MYTKYTQIQHLKYFLITLSFFTVTITTMAQEKYVFQEKELLNQQDSLERPYLRFLDNDQLSSGIYVLKAGTEDGQQPHEWDEIYYVLEGIGKIQILQNSYEVVPGSIIFVPAHASHKFFDFPEDLKLLVFFSKKETE